MLDLEINFSDTCKVWESKTRWYFVQLPLDKAEEVRFFSTNLQTKKRGGAVKVTAKIGEIEWQTSIFPSFKSDLSEAGLYFLLLKADIRKRAKIAEGNTVTIHLKISL